MTDPINQEPPMAMIPAWVDGTLVPREKLRVHQEGIQHLAVSVFLIADGKILLQKRAAGKYHTPGLWANTCCTHPHWGESTAHCAARRLDDELGIQGIFPKLRHRVSYQADVGSGLIENEVVDVFVLDVPTDLPIRPNPDEVEATQWLSVQELGGQISRNPEQFTPWLKIYLREHRTQIFGT